MLRDNFAKKNKIEEYIASDQLFKLYSRNICLQITENFFYYSLIELKKSRGINFSQLAISNCDFADCYGKIDEFRIVKKQVEKIYKQSASIKEYYEDLALPVFREYLAFTKKMHQKYLAKNGAVFGLIKDFEKFSAINARFISNLWFIYLSDPVIDELSKKLMAKFLKSKNKSSELSEYLTLISTTLKKPAVICEHEELLGIAAMKNGKNQSEKLKRHCIKWRWFPCFNPCDDAYDLNYYKRELNQIDRQAAKLELKKIKDEKLKHRNNYEKLLKQVKDEEILKLIKMTNDVSFYREYRNDLRRQGLFLVRPLYEAIGQKLDLNVKQICYLTQEEIIDSLNKNKLSVSKSILKMRMKRFVMLADSEDHFLLDDIEVADKLASKIEKKNQVTTEIKGQIAAKGFATGRVTVISRIEKLKTFTKGNILVASMTAPDYLPAMKKAAAFITDEGGITCHAAIVAREMKKPCIIGTKIATQVLQDGDLVEVDADRGVVKIFKRFVK
jgi:phosphohistidine swiveling domain-containing protein